MNVHSFTKVSLSCQENLAKRVFGMRAYWNVGKKGFEGSKTIYK
jgi:hypothetical protein